MKIVEITEKRYLELVEAELELQALNSGGVDNWQWYCESRHDYLKFLREEGYSKEDIIKYCKLESIELYQMKLKPGAFSMFAEKLL